MTDLRLVVADDEPLVLEGLRLVLNAEPGIEIVGEALQGAEALALTRQNRPDVLLTDIRMPGTDGIALTRAVRRDPALTKTHVLLLTTFAEDDYLVAAVREGAAGYLLKSMPPAEIRAAVRAAAVGGTPLAPMLVRRLLREYSERRIERDSRLDLLTEREAEVLTRLAAGESNSEIAGRLFIGEGTVKTHVAAILRKLGVRDRTQAVVAAYELGLVRPGH
jgi:DNA-binding NarL/FixJ family response regulator